MTIFPDTIIKSVQIVLHLYFFCITYLLIWYNFPLQSLTYFHLYTTPLV